MSEVELDPGEPHVAEIEAIRRGRHRDAFRILGPHILDVGWEIRAWLPQAREVSVIIGPEVVPMELAHPAGFFTAKLWGPPGQYHLRAPFYSGEIRDLEDPYRFPPLLTSFELHLHGEGTNYESYRTLGAHQVDCEGVNGIRFAVWAPNADVVSVIGDFNGWDRTRHPMRLRDGGIWEIFIPELTQGACYKFSVLSHGHEQQKCDPYGFFAEVPPKTASIA